MSLVMVTYIKVEPKVSLHSSLNTELLINDISGNIVFFINSSYSSSITNLFQILMNHLS